jgi:DNA polymerase
MRSSFLSDRQTIFLAEMGIGPVWIRRDPDDAATDSAESVGIAPEAATTSPPASAWSIPLESPADATAASSPSDAEIAGMEWSELKATVAACTRCGLCNSRTKTVFGVGDEKAAWLFVGEGPGRSEDAQGEPFVGPAGKLLDNMLLAIGLRRGANAYIANIVKCRATDANGRDRPPTKQEAAACLPYLERQIALIQPGIVIALGKSAAISLLQLDAGVAVSELRGKIHRYAGLPLVVTYHPAYLLRALIEKRKAWADLCLATNAYASAPRS